MSEDVFISYCHENKEAARILAETIIAKGFSVWWDHDLVAGDSYTEVIEKALDGAKAVIVIWSEQSRKSHWVRDEAAVGRDRNRLLPVSIDDNPPPLGFRQIQTVDLQGWDGVEPTRMEPLFLGLNGLLKTKDAAPTARHASAAASPFGAPAASTVEAKGGKVLSGVNARPNNKPLKQILREEKKQRGFFRTYWLTSFLVSGLLAVASAVVLPNIGVSGMEASGSTVSERIGNYLGVGIAMFIAVGFGLFVGRALIIVGRRLSKRKSIRYFDSTTLIVMAVTLVLAAMFAIFAASRPAEPGGTQYTVTENIAYSAIFGISTMFPIVAFVSMLIGFFRGLGRTSFADGQ